jgi:methylamine dehydrogenase accessory protein MauD
LAPGLCYELYLYPLKAKVSGGELMNGVWLASHIVLWVLMILVILTMLALARQVGLLNRRIPAVGAREEGGGPDVGDPAPSFDEVDLTGRRVTLGADGKRTLLAFISSACRACDEIAPALRSIAKSDRSTTDVVAVTEDSPSVAREWVARHRLTEVPLVAGFSRAEEFGSLMTPYAIAVDERGIVRGKGLVNHLEHLGSLINALDLDDSAFLEWRGTATADDRVGQESEQAVQIGGVRSRRHEHAK